MTFRGRDRDRSRGQALVEFAIILPVFVLLLAGVVQFGILFWAQNTLTQVARDTGRWASTQAPPTGCSNAAGVVATANSLAASSGLIGYTSGSWSPANVRVTWRVDGGSVITAGANRNCPPKTNQTAAWVKVVIEHDAPVFFPREFVPGDGHLTSSAEFRMEPFE